MKNKTSIILILIMLLITTLSLSSCTQTNDINYTDPYEFTLNTTLREERINAIGTTSTGKTLIYVTQTQISKTYFVYTFDNNKCTHKYIHTFYNDLDSFRKYFETYDYRVDGTYYEINESILLVSTFFEIQKEITYADLYKVVSTKYEIV